MGCGPPGRTAVLLTQVRAHLGTSQLRLPTICREGSTHQTLQMPRGQALGVGTLETISDHICLGQPHRPGY